jgi:hypothetical protein
MGREAEVMVESGLKHNRNTYLKYKCRCEECVRDNSLYKLKRRREKTYPLRLDGKVFVERLYKDNRTNAVGRKSLDRWLKEGIELYSADRMCMKLGYHPVEIWGQAFYEGCFSYE